MLETCKYSNELFIATELRPHVGPHYECHPPLPPDLAKDEMLKVARELMGQRLDLPVVPPEGTFPIRDREACFLHSAETVWTNLADEADLFHLETCVR